MNPLEQLIDPNTLFKYFLIVMVFQLAFSFLFYFTFGDEMKVVFKYFIVFSVVFLLLMVILGPLVYKAPKAVQPEAEEEKKNK